MQVVVSVWALLFLVVQSTLRVWRRRNHYTWAVEFRTCHITIYLQQSSLNLPPFVSLLFDLGPSLLKWEMTSRYINREFIFIYQTWKQNPAAHPFLRVAEAPAPAPKSLYSEYNIPGTKTIYFGVQLVEGVFCLWLTTMEMWTASTKAQQQ